MKDEIPAAKDQASAPEKEPSPAPLREQPAAPVTQAAPSPAPEPPTRPPEVIPEPPPSPAPASIEVEELEPSATDTAPPSDLMTSVEIPVSEEMPAAVSAAEPTFSAVGRLGVEAVLAKLQKVTKRQLAITGGAVGALLIILLLATRTSTGTLVVTVSDPSGSPIKAASVTVDGTGRCPTSPCTVKKLKRGSHLVRVSAAGYKVASEQKTEVESGARTQLALLLVPEPTPVAMANPAPAEPPPSPAVTPPADEEETTKPASRRSATVSAPPPKGPAQAAARGAEPSGVAAKTPPTTTGSGSLSVTSQPPGMVFVDGRALGETPRQITLPAGPHTVIIENPDYGSKTIRVTIEPGKTASVGVTL